MKAIKSPVANAAGAPASSRYPLILLLIFVAWWSLLAIAPHYREDWLLENLLVFVAIPLLVWSHRRLPFSNFAYSALFVFFCLHSVGSYYTYSEVPYAEWYTRLTGHDLPALLGTDRNHFDRLMHFLYGFLLMPSIVQLLDARGQLTGIWKQLVPVMFIMSNSELYEMIEWQAAEFFGGELGQAYLGAQGDIWDAQKDSALAMLGAIISLVLYRRIQAHGRG